MRRAHRSAASSDRRGSVCSRASRPAPRDRGARRRSRTSRPGRASASPGATAEIAQDAGHDGGRRCASTSTSARAATSSCARPSRSTLPANYAFTFHIRGEAPPNNLEFKLVDPTGENVWWAIERDFDFPHDWQRVVIAQVAARVRLGPARRRAAEARRLHRVRHHRRQGGKGSVWIDDLRFERARRRAAVDRRADGDRLDLAYRATSRTPILDDDPRPAGSSGSVAERAVAAARLRQSRASTAAWSSTGTPRTSPPPTTCEVSDDGETWTQRYRSDARQRRPRLHLPARRRVALRPPRARAEQPRPGLRHRASAR